VPFSDKDAAKAAGARWSPQQRRWFAPRPDIRELDPWLALPELPPLLPGEDRTFGSGLFVDLIPKSCWFTNVRSCVDTRHWDRLRRMVYDRAGELLHRRHRPYGPWNGAPQGEPRRLRTVRDRENLPARGPRAARRRKGMHVAWYTLEDLGGLVRRHRADDSVSKAITRILRAEIVMMDDIGLLPVAVDAAEGLYRLVDAAYEKRSVAISSNLHPSGFDELMPKTLATATVDRLLHHAHVCQTTGESVRLFQAIAGQGVTPLI